MFNIFKSKEKISEYVLVRMNISQNIPAEEHVKFFTGISPKNFYENLFASVGLKRGLTPDMFTRSHIELIMDKSALVELQRVNSKLLKKNGVLLVLIGSYTTYPAMSMDSTFVFIGSRWGSPDILTASKDSSSGVVSIDYSEFQLGIDADTWFDEEQESMDLSEVLDNIDLTEIYNLYGLLNKIAPYVLHSSSKSLPIIDVGSARRADIFERLKEHCEYHPEIVPEKAFNNIFSGGNPYETFN